MSVQVRRARVEDADGCVAVVASLPDYFSPSTHDEVRRGIRGQPSWVAIEDGELVGFVLAAQRFLAAAEITHARVVPSHRGRGIGTALVARCLADLAADGVVMVEVKTLDSSAGYAPYVATRAFWERRGFIQIDCIDPVPGWDPGNPTAIYARPIR